MKRFVSLLILGILIFAAASQAVMTAMSADVTSLPVHPYADRIPDRACAASLIWYEPSELAKVDRVVIEERDYRAVLKGNWRGKSLIADFIVIELYDCQTNLLTYCVRPAVTAGIRPMLTRVEDKTSDRLRYTVIGLDGKDYVSEYGAADLIEADRFPVPLSTVAPQS